MSFNILPPPPPPYEAFQETPPLEWKHRRRIQCFQFRRLTQEARCNVGHDGGIGTALGLKSARPVIFIRREENKQNKNTSAAHRPGVARNGGGAKPGRPSFCCSMEPPAETRAGGSTPSLFRFRLHRHHTFPRQQPRTRAHNARAC